MRATVERLAEQEATRFRDTCGKCGATRIDQQLGLEPTPEEYVTRMVEVFREVRRVLASHGTVWINLGDSYGSGTTADRNPTSTQGPDVPASWSNRSQPQRNGLKPKDLVGIPWRVAFALQQPYYTGRIKDERDRGQGSRYTHEKGVGKSNRKQTLYRITLTGQQSRELLRELYPHLVAKQHEARIAYHSPSSGEGAEAAWLAVKALHNGEGATVDYPAPPTLFEPGWYLRSDVIWGKPNPMPESVTDRPTKAHEYVFLLSKQPRYFFDQEAVREAYRYDGRKATAISEGGSNGHENHASRKGRERWPGIGKAQAQARADVIAGGTDESEPMDVTHGGRNIRSVWEIATQPYPEAHFATFPEELARRCIAAGCPEQVCRVCGKARERLTEVQRHNTSAPNDRSEIERPYGAGHTGLEARGRSPGWRKRPPDETVTLGFTDCGHSDYRIGLTLDPFMGSGTVAHVARKLGRHAVGIDLNAEYLELAARRLQQQSLFAEVASGL